jgi:ribosomal protein S18 acetylase RimI-like enzyme
MSELTIKDLKGHRAVFTTQVGDYMLPEIQSLLTSQIGATKMVSYKKEYPDGVLARGETYLDSILLVCLLDKKSILTDKSTPDDIAKNPNCFKLAGVMQAGIKDVFIGGIVRRAFFIIDLKVDIAYRRLGIGKTLINQVTKVALDKKCDLSYVAVQSDNIRSLGLLEGEGYSIADGREHEIVPLDLYNLKSLLSSPDPNTRLINYTRAQIEQRQTDETLRRYLDDMKEIYKEIDLSPTDTVNYLLKNKTFMGVAFLVDKSTNKLVAGCHFHAFNSNGAIIPKKILVDLKLFKNQWMFTIGAFLISALWITLVYFMKTLTPADTGFGVLSFISYIVLVAVLLLWYFFCLICSSFQNSERLALRQTGGFSTNQQKFREYMNQLILQNYRNFLNAGFKMIILNYSARRSVEESVKLGSFKFLVKDLRSDQHFKLSKFRAPNYFDPTDY